MIDVGEHVLWADTPGQEIEVHVTGGDPVQGVEFLVQVADGGPEAKDVGFPITGIDGPAVTHVDLVTSTIFAGNNTGQPAGDALPQLVQTGTTTEHDTVSANGLLATLTIDTTGFFQDDPNHPWDLKLVGTLIGDTHFPGVPGDVTNGTIRVVPKREVVITESDGATIVTEGGVTDSYTVALASQPGADVEVTITPDSQVSVSSTNVTFTTANWNAPQTVTVTAVDDAVVEGLHNGSITHTATSADPLYNGIPVRSVTVNVTDNDTLRIDVGDRVLYENKPGQEIQIYVTGAGQVQGVEFFTQVADGGPEAGGAIDGPAITNVDILTNTIFAANNTGQRGGSLVSQFWQAGTTTDHETVTADGLLATITIDTTGFFVADPNHAWDLKLIGTLMGDSSFPGVPTLITNGTITLRRPAVTDRHVFYNGSYFDDNDPAANADDDGAIAPHTQLKGGHGPHSTGYDEPDKELGKDALLPGQTATFANYTSYARGINGIMVDIGGLANPAGLSASDFRFRVGNDNDPDAWTEPAVAPTVAVRPRAGTDDSDRVTLLWPDNTIQKQWLQVTVLATANTGLPRNDVFYFGNAIGESGEGNYPPFAYVTISDELGARNHPHTFLNRAAVSDPYDFNRDSYVTITDELTARNSGTSFLDALRLITVPSVVTTDDRAATDEDSPVPIDVLANDRDEAGPSLNVDRVDATSTLGAALTLNLDDTVQYDPSGSATLQALNSGETLEDTFTYTIRDSLGGTDTATVHVTVTGLDESSGSQGSGLLSAASFDSGVIVAVARLETGVDAETANDSINTWARDALEFEPSTGGERGHNGGQRAGAADQLLARTRPMLLLPPGYRAALDGILEEESGSLKSFSGEWARPDPFDEAGAEGRRSGEDEDREHHAEDAADIVLEAFRP